MSGFHVFTTILVQDGQPRYLDEHLARLKDHATHFGTSMDHLSCQRRGAPCEGLASKVETLAGMTCLMRIAIDQTGDISITARDLNPPTNNTRIIVTDIKVDPKLAAFKTSARAPYEKARELAAQCDAFEALLIDDEGYVVDGSRSSPLLFCDGALISLEGGLKGITREKVLSEAASFGIEVRRERRKASELSGTLLVAGSGIGLVSSNTLENPRIANLIRKFLPQLY